MLRTVLFRLTIALLLVVSVMPVFTADVAADSGTAIIADHTVVDQYDDIPQYWIDQVMKMRFNVPGQSHAKGYLIGLELLAEKEIDYPASVRFHTIQGTEPYREDALRADRYTWGVGTGAGEQHWYTWHAYDNPDDDAYYADYIKNHLTYYDETNPEYDIAAIGFGWCFDMMWHNPPGGVEDPVYHVRWAGSSEHGPDGDMRWGLDDDDIALTSNNVTMNDYLQATEEYIQYIEQNNYDTKVFFTTGPVEFEAYNTGETGYQREIKHNYIREHFDDTYPNAALFDYADILAYNGTGQQNTVSWTDPYETEHVYPVIHPDNMLDLDGSPAFDDGDHIGQRGALRLGKALWWFLARLAGWDGTAAGSTDTEAPSVTVSSPNGDEKYKAGCQYDITWAATDNVSVTSCNISYSIDNGTSYTDIATGETNDGTYTWTVPDNPSATCLVRVAAGDAAGNWGQDESNAVFEMFGSIPGDADNDCDVDINDITKAELIILEVDDTTDDADANEDTFVNALDITKIEQIIST